MVKLFHMWLENSCYKKYKEMQVPTKLHSMKKTDGRVPTTQRQGLLIRGWSPLMYTPANSHSITPAPLHYLEAKTLYHFDGKYSLNLSQKMTSVFWERYSCWHTSENFQWPGLVRGSENRVPTNSGVIINWYNIFAGQFFISIQT